MLVVVPVHVREEVQDRDLVRVERRVIARAVSGLLERQGNLEVRVGGLNDLLPLGRRPDSVDDQGVGLEPAHHVEIQHRDGALERHDGVPDVERRADEPQLFAGECDEEDGAGRTRAARDPPGRLDHRRDARRVVIGAVVDLAARAGAAELAVAEVVVVGSHDQDLLAQHGVRALEESEHVSALPRRRVRVRGAGQLEALEEPVYSGRGEPGLLEARGDVLAGAVLAPRAGEPTLQVVGGQIPHDIERGPLGAERRTYVSDGASRRRDALVQLLRLGEARAEAGSNPAHDEGQEGRVETAAECVYQCAHLGIPHAFPSHRRFCRATHAVPRTGGQDRIHPEGR